MKYLIENHPSDWLEFLGLPLAHAEIIEAELSIVTASADKLLRVYADPPSLAHIEFQSGYDAAMGDRTLRYNVLIDYEHEETVESFVILLCPEADGPAMTGRVERYSRDGSLILDFRYRVIRVWKLPVETLLAGGAGLLPLAPLADVTVAQLPEVIQRMEERLQQEVSPAEAAELWTGTFILMGLRYPPALTGALLKGVRNMKESATYQAILEEGGYGFRFSVKSRLLYLEATGFTENRAHYQRARPKGKPEVARKANSRPRERFCCALGRSASGRRTQRPSLL